MSASASEIAPGRGSLVLLFPEELFERLQLDCRALLELQSHAADSLRERGLRPLADKLLMAELVDATHAPEAHEQGEENCRADKNHDLLCHDHSSYG